MLELEVKMSSVKTLRRVLECGRLCRLSTTAHGMSSRNKPRNSGDKGPEKNYVKNVMKKANKDSDTEGTARAAFMEALKAIESGQIPQDKQAQEDKLDSLFKSDKGSGGHSKRWRPRVDENWNRLGGNRMSEEDKAPINFANPESGPRLGIFNRLGNDVNIMPSGRPNLTEEDKDKQLEEIRLLQTSHFKDQLKVPYPRKFPVDNENYEQITHFSTWDEYFWIDEDKGSYTEVEGMQPNTNLWQGEILIVAKNVGRSEESDVSFKDHVLLDHLIREFPSKGPVRHFMELVVTGLSMNPDYTVTEKQEIIKWYKEYFSQFTPEELQALSLESLEPDAVK